MKNIEKDFNNKVKLVFAILLAVSILLIYLGKDNYIGVVKNLAASIIIGLFTTALSQSIVQRFTGGSLEQIFLNVNILGKKYSISIFIIISIMVKLFIFK